MFKLDSLEDNIFYVKIYSPRQDEDAQFFFDFLERLKKTKNFALILETQGEARFSPENKKKMTVWFKTNKAFLEQECRALIRLQQSMSTLSKLSSKAMRLAMPCPYHVTDSFNDALNWAKKNI